MKLLKSYSFNIALLVLLTAAFLFSCKKDGNPNHLPSVSPAIYEGKIDGYTSSDEVYPNNLIAYWNFDDTKNELKTSTAPGSSANDSYVADAIRGKSLNLTAGYLYYPVNFPKFDSANLKSWSISLWVKIKNNGTKRTMLFQLARPGIFNGNLNFILNTNGYPASNDTVLRIQPMFATASSTATTTATQDNLNSGAGQDKTNLNKWQHIVLTYDFSTGVFNIWLNSVKVGNFPNRGTGGSSFKCWQPNEVIIGANYNSIPGKSVSSDVSFAAMTGQLDEIRFYNKLLPDAQIRALYNLGNAGK